MLRTSSKHLLITATLNKLKKNTTCFTSVTTSYIFQHVDLNSLSLSMTALPPSHTVNSVAPAVNSSGNCPLLALMDYYLFSLWKKHSLWCDKLPVHMWPLLQVHISTSERPVVAGHPPQRQRQSLEPGCGQRPQHHAWYVSLWVVVVEREKGPSHPAPNLQLH